MKIPVPCYNCTSRHFCCHSTCSKYLAYKEQLELLNSYKRQQKELDRFNYAVKHAIAAKQHNNEYYERNK